MSKVKITKDSYVLTGDIPNEEIFNRIKEKFAEAGFTATGWLGLWSDRSCVVALGVSPATGSILWLTSDRLKGRTRLTPQQILGDDYMSQYPNGKADDIVYVQMTKADVVIIRSILDKTRLCSKLYNSLVAEKYAQENIFRHFSWSDIQTLSAPTVNKLVSKVFAPAQPTEKELLQAKIQELQAKLKELEELDND